MNHSKPEPRPRTGGRLARIRRDRHGYLLDPADWDVALAAELAAEEQLPIDERHLEIVTILRNFHSEYDFSPATRILARLVREQLGADKGNSMYLMKLFPGGAIRQGCKIAGLPRPRQCF